MPVAVIALAAGSFAAGASAFAAATTLAGMVAAGATMAGAALTIVGTVTGNAKLTKIGAIVGIAGSLGSMAVNAAAGAEAAAGAGESASSGVADAATSAATDAAADTAGSAITTAPVDLGTDGITKMAGDAASKGAADVSGQLVKPVADQVASTASATAPASGGGMLNAAAAPDASLSPLQATNSAGNAFDASATQVGQTNNINAFKAPGPFDGNAAIRAGDYAGATDTSGAFSSGATGVNVGVPVAADPGMLTQLNNWAKANPLLAKAALDTAGGVAKGLVPSPADKAMMDRYRQQNENDKRRALWGSGRTV